MNYCLDFSIRVEDELLRQIAGYEREHPGEDITRAKEDELYSIAMEIALTSDEDKPWANGDIRVGEFILIVDCDARVVSHQSRRRALIMLAN